MLKQAFDHIMAPVDDYHVRTLQSAAVCGVLTFVFVIVGANRLISLVVYVLIIALVFLTAWYYTLTPPLRTRVSTRVRDVAEMFWRNCVNESFGNDVLPRSEDNGRVDGGIVTRTKTKGCLSRKDSRVGGTSVVKDNGKTGADMISREDHKVHTQKNIESLSHEYLTLFE